MIVDLGGISDVITAGALLITAVMTGVNTYLARQAVKSIEVVHKATNSLTDRLVTSESSKARAEGVKEGRGEVLTRDEVKPKTVDLAEVRAEAKQEARAEIRDAAEKKAGAEALKPQT